MPWLPKTPRLRVLLVLAGLTLTLLVADLPARGPNRGPLAGGLVRASSCCADDSTPDCGAGEVDPFPQRQRALHLARLGVDRWHAAGTAGRGVKIAILDTGFRGYRAQLGKALP